MKNMRPYVSPLQLNRSVGQVLHTAGDRSTPNPRSFVPPIAPTQERASPAVQHIRSVYTAETRSDFLCRFVEVSVRSLRQSAPVPQGVVSLQRASRTWAPRALHKQPSI